MYLNANPTEWQTGSFIRIALNVMGPLVGRHLGGEDMAENLGNVGCVPAMKSDAEGPQ